MSVENSKLQFRCTLDVVHNEKPFRLKVAIPEYEDRSKFKIYEFKFSKHLEALNLAAGYWNMYARDTWEIWAFHDEKVMMYEQILSLPFADT